MFCDDAGFGPVLATAPDLTPCFHQSVVSAIPCVVMVVVFLHAGFQARFRQLYSPLHMRIGLTLDQESKRITKARVWMIGCLALFPLVLMLTRLAIASTLETALLLQAGLQAVTWTLSFVWIRAIQQKNTALPHSLKIAWLIAFVIQLKIMQNSILVAVVDSSSWFLALSLLTATQSALIFTTSAAGILFRHRIHNYGQDLESGLEDPLLPVPRAAPSTSLLTGSPVREIWKKWLTDGAEPEATRNSRKLILDVSVPDWIEVQTSNLSSHVDFAIRVKSLHAGVYTVYKRYKQLQVFHKHLAKRGMADLPPLPAAHIMPQLEERRQGIETYLKQLTENSRVTDDLGTFLEVSNRILSQNRDSLAQHSPRSSTIVSSLSIEEKSNTQERPHLPRDTPNRYHKTHELVIFDVRVTSFALWKPVQDDGALFASFCFDVDTSVGQWSTHKRLSDVVALDRELVSVFRDTDEIVPRFDAPHYVSVDVAHLEEQRVAMEEYIQALLHLTSQLPQLDAFLSHPEEYTDETWVQSHPSSPSLGAVRQYIPNSGRIEFPSMQSELKITMHEHTTIEEEGESFTQFVIGVHAIANGRAIQDWEVQRRYREFSALHKALRHEFKQDLPSLPPKSYGISASSKSFITTRMVLLENYLNTVVKHISPSYPALAAFLNVPDRV